MWLAGSMVAAVLAAWGAWILRRTDDAERPWLARWRNWPGRPWVIQTIRILYAVGIPAAALLWRGILTERGLGIQSFPWSQTIAPASMPASYRNWALDLGWTLLIATGAAMIIVLGERHQLSPHPPEIHHDLGLALREAIYHEIHWAFYREPFVLLRGTAVGAWAGLIPVLLEAVLNPMRWGDLHSPARGRDLLVRALLAVVSVLIFLQTQNLWVALLADAGLGWVAGMTRASLRDQVAPQRRLDAATILTQ